MRSSEPTEGIVGVEPDALDRMVTVLKDVVEAFADAIARVVRVAIRLFGKLAKRLDPRWQRRCRRALARSRRNNLYLKSVGRCR
ncbi:hypothetical protein [Paratractidigestivibacter sp.]|uniref:hypothetical protein n=1 Tax=Paratractidigestivibacter sp. TaxID=2847316 RepID=UPI002AC913CA|nr:hypothetical protein [Paratractidigestivibacter sp.]